MLFKWKDSFSCNIEEIDKQHKHLFELGTDLYNILSARDGLDHYDDIMAIIAKLREYTIYHFNYEEELMIKFGYQDYAQHKSQHKAFVDKIISLEAQDIDSKQNRITIEILDFVANWIENHILKTDFKYKDFLNSKGIY